jgi:hypothetical protein
MQTTRNARQNYLAVKRDRRRRLRIEQRSAKFNYKERNEILYLLGFDSYADYLLSPIWADIRNEVLAREPQCQICRVTKSTEAHHRQYTKQNLMKAIFCDMVACCRYCHNKIEFLPNGDKRFIIKEPIIKAKTRQEYRLFPLKRRRRKR